jgi:hypothetical protein
MAKSGAVSLSKSKLTAYHQCRKRLWLEIHRPELREDSPASQKAFAIGHTIGDLAQREYPDGILIGPASPDAPINWPQVFAETKQALSLNPRRPIFEATCRHDGVLVRADLLIPAAQGWHMAEVKSSTEVKDYHLNDVAVQTWVMRESGVDVRTVELRHVDNQFVYPGGNDYAGLFKAGDVQDQVEALQPEVPRWIADARAVVASSEPKVSMGDHCEKPFACSFAGYCAQLAGPPPDYPVTLLPGNGGKPLARRLLDEGYEDLRDVPGDRMPPGRLALIHRVTVSGEPHLDGDKAREMLAALPYPRFFFDFETISFSVPIWAGTRPYEKLPFQWSCHIERMPGQFEHQEFLDLSGDNPIRACAEDLLRVLETEGPILAYHDSFERGVIKALAERYPDLHDALMAAHARFFDLEKAVRDCYYHPAMMGSWSIKKVLPTVAPDLDYAKLEEVQDGGGAQEAYVNAIDPDVTPERKAELRQRLLTYCGLDTWAMVVLAWFLEGRGRPV